MESTRIELRFRFPETAKKADLDQHGMLIT